jgi:hypothetical protein
MVAEPSATAVTNPVDETVTTPVSDDDQSTVASAIELPPASVTVAVSVSVSPMTPNVTESRESSRVAGSWATVTAAVPVAEPEVAVIVAVPSAIEVTRPEDEAVATAASDVAHVTVAPLIVAPPASFTVADSWVVSPNKANVSTVSANAMLAATCPTVTAAVPVAEPEVAVIVAVPSAIEVTRPEDEAVATAASDVAHVTVAPLIVPPFWSLTVAEIWDVAPSEARLRLVTERVIEVATGVGLGVGAVGVSSPPQLHKNSGSTKALNATVCFMP